MHIASLQNKQILPSSGSVGKSDECFSILVLEDSFAAYFGGINPPDIYQQFKT